MKGRTHGSFIGIRLAWGFAAALAAAFGGPVHIPCSAQEAAATAQTAPAATTRPVAEMSAIKITGVVQDANGKPLARAGVWLRQWTKGGYRRIARAELKHLMTGDDGTFQFQWQSPAGEHSTLTIVAWKAGLCCDGTYITREESEYRRRPGSYSFTLRLGPPAELAGQVVDESGKGLKGIHIISSPGKYYGADLPLLCAETDPNGQFVIHNLPRDAGVKLVLSGPGRARDMVWGLTPGQKDVRITLPKEAKIIGRVIEHSTGKPVAGVPLVVFAGLAEVYGNPLAVSDKDGRFVFDGLPERKYFPGIYDNGPATNAWVSAYTEVDLKPGQVASDAVVELYPAGIIDVHLTDKATGKALPGVHLHIVGRDGWHIWRATDGKGVATIPVQPGKWGVYASKFGYKTPSATGQWSMMALEMDDYLASVEVKEGQTEKVDTYMIPLPAARGVVRSPTGKPLAGVRVSQMPDYGYGPGVDTDDDGRFKVSLAPPDVGPDDHVYAVTRDKTMAAIVPVGDAKHELDIRLAPVATIRLTVRDTAGRPIRSAWIHCSTVLGKTEAGVDIGLLGTDDQGMAEIKRLPAGRRYSLSIKAEGFGEKQTDVNVPAESAGKAIDLPPVVLPGAKRSP